MALTNLTGTTWKFNDTIDFTLISSDTTFNINFIIFQSQATSLKIQPSNNTILAYIPELDNVQIYNNGWPSEDWKTISITGGTDATNSTLITWLQKNATWTNQPQGVFVSYSGSEIATMEESGTKTLLTSGKYCEDDIVVEYTKPTPKLQEKTITPTTEQQIVLPDNSLAGRISVGTTSTSYKGSTSISVFTVENQNYIANATYSFQGKFVGSNGGVISLRGSKTGDLGSVSLEFNTNYTYDNINIKAIVWWAELDTTMREQLLIQLGSGYNNITWTVAEEVIITNDAYETYEGLSSVTVNAMPSGTAGTPTATKGTVSNHSISVTPSVTNTTGYITGGTINGTPVTIDVTELESGTKTITENGTGISVSGYSTVDVAVQAGTIIDDGDGNINLSPTGEVAVITPLTVNQNGIYTAPSGTAYSPVTVNVSGGGGLEYEEGTFVPTEDVAKPIISFANTHNEPPMFAMMIDASTTPTMETYTQYSFIFTDWYRFSGTGFPYGSTSDLRYGFFRDDYRASSTISVTNSAALFAHNSDQFAIGDSTYPNYFVTNTEFKPSPGASTDRYWRAGRTYKWIAVWSPTT